MQSLLFFMSTSSVTGGVETWLDRICQFSTQRGFKPVVGLVRGQRYNRPERYKALHTQLQTVEVDGRGLDREGRVRALTRCIRQINPDIVMPMGIVDAYEATIRAKQRGQPVRLAVHAQGNLAPMLADLALYRDWIDHVVCPGQLTARVLIQWAGFASTRVTHIPNGADTPICQRKLRKPNDALRIGYIGRLTQNDKRAMDLVGLHQALEELNINYKLDIVGEGPCLSALEVAFRDAKPQVQLHGGLPHETIYREIFPKLDILVLLSSSEAFGIVLAEAMMHGVIPVTAKYLGFYAEQLVTDETTGLSFSIGDMAAAAAAINQLATVPELSQKLSAQAKEQAQRYSWKKSLDSWEQVFQKTMKAVPVIGSSLSEERDFASSGRLSQLGIPPSAVDWIRRLRRAVLGPSVPPGGEEWPLFLRTHTEEKLMEIQRVSKQLDISQSTYLRNFS